MGMQVGTGRVNSEINVTPLVDVVLVLLIIFMIVSPMLTVGYDLDVPQKLEDDVIIPEEVLQDQLIVTYTKDGDLYINKDPVAAEALEQTLSNILSGRRKKTVFFAAARELNYGDVVVAMDGIRTAGADAIGLVTDERLTVAPQEQGAAAPAAEAAPSGQ